MRRWATGCGVVLLALALVAPARGAVPATVESGSLRATVTPDPWHLELREGRTLLSEAAGPGSGPTGPLGFEAGGTWFHATRACPRATRRRKYRPRRWRPTTRWGARSSCASSPRRRRDRALGERHGGVSTTGIGFAAPAGERYLGFGERSNAVDQRGNEVENYVSDGPVPAGRARRRRGDRPALGLPRAPTTRPTSRSPGCSRRAATACSSTTTRRAASTSARPRGRVERRGRRRRAGAARLRRARRPPTSLRRFTARVGRQPPAAAPWFFGPWFQPTGDDARGAARRDAARRPTRRSRSPRPTRTTCRAATSRATTAAERARAERFHAAGLAITTYFNPMICTGYTPRYDAGRAPRRC